MAIVINGSGTVTGLAVGGLPDGTVDAGTLATDSVTAAKIAANSVDSAELVDGAVDASHLSGGDNTPSFKVLGVDSTSIPNATWTKVIFSTEVWDTDNAFASSRFTVPTGKGGKYQFHFRVKISGVDDNEYLRAHLYKNGTRVEASGNEFHSPGSDLQVPSQGFYAITLVPTDYIELYAYHNEGGTRTMFGGTNEATSDASYLQAIRLIGV